MKPIRCPASLSTPSSTDPPLKADILGINAPEATGAQLFNQAQDLIGQITANSTAQDVAGMQQQFDALIRSIAPEDQLSMQAEIVAIIELFRTRANEVLNARRQETLDNAAVMRELIDGLLVRVGDPMDIIASALEGRNLPEVMEDGLSRIDATVATIGPQVSNAIVAGLSGVQINRRVRQWRYGHTMTRTVPAVVSAAVAQDATTPVYLIRMGWDLASPDMTRRIATWASNISWNSEVWTASGAEVRSLSASGGSLRLPNGDSDPWLTLVTSSTARGRAIDIYEYHTSTSSPAGSSAVILFSGLMDQRLEQRVIEERFCG